MNTAIPARLSKLPIKPYIRPILEPKTKRATMTIAAGFECDQGIVLCADRLISHGKATDFGSFAHYEKKMFGLEGRNFTAAVCGAGDATLIRPIAESFLTRINYPLDEKNQPETETFESALENTLNDFGGKINAIPDLSLLVACSGEEQGDSRFMRSDGLVVYPAKSVEILGIGETSLVRYLVDTIYKPDMPLKHLTVLAVLIIAVAKKYCPQYCGGQTDIYMMKKPYDILDTLSLSEHKITKIEQIFANKTPERLLGLIHEIAEQSLSSVFFTLRHRALIAFRADSLRCSAVIAAALAGPPFFPPFLPNFDRYALSSGDILAMPQVYTRTAYVAS
jgi:hypothetical protein